MSALPPKADMAQSDWHVRFVPKADIEHSRCALDDWSRYGVSNPLIAIFEARHHVIW